MEDDSCGFKDSDTVCWPRFVPAYYRPPILNEVVSILSLTHFFSPTHLFFIQYFDVCLIFSETWMMTVIFLTGVTVIFSFIAVLFIYE
jgi:hypothetical protein